MMPINVLISEVSVEILSHMKSAKNTTEVTRLVEDFMSDCEMSCIEVAVNICKSN